MDYRLMVKGALIVLVTVICIPVQAAANTEKLREKVNNFITSYGKYVAGVTTITLVGIAIIKRKTLFSRGTTQSHAGKII